MPGFFNAKRKLEISRKALAVFTAAFLVFQTGAVLFSSFSSASAGAPVWPGDCGFQCTANDVDITRFWLGDASGNDLSSCTVGDPVTAYIWANFRNNATSKRYAVILLAQIWVDGSLEHDFYNDVPAGYCSLDEIPGGGISSGMIYGQGGTFTWICGQEVEVRDIIVSWEPPGGGNSCATAQRDCSARGTSKCWKTESMIVEPPPYCGDGEINQPGEECDDGELNGQVCDPGYEGECEYCSATCIIETAEGPYCGDGQINGPEACEDAQQQVCMVGNYNGIQTCVAEACQWGECEPTEWCGDGVKNGNEECDGTDGVPEHYTCTQTCTLEYVPYCGDGSVDPGEECDDGNNEDGDGCDSQCQYEPLTIYGYKVVCEDEADLPNWGLLPGQPAPISATTAQDWVNSHPGCHLDPGWSFQWGPSSVVNPGDNTGEATPASGWTTFGPTDGSGQTTVTIGYFETDRLWLREVWQENYIPFTYGITGDDSDNVSAEFYCHGDVYHYDNYDYIQSPEPGQTYRCVAFNTINYGSISGHKWEDVDGDSYWDGGEPTLDGWTIFLDEDGNKTLDAGELSTTTSGGGVYSFSNLVPGDYDVCEVLEPGWTRTLPGVGLDCYYLTVLPGQNLIDYDFGNFKHAKLSGYKVEDVDGDSDPAESMGEPRLDGWTINLEKQGEGIVDSVITGDGVWSDGYYEFIITSPGTYTLTEVSQADWIETYPNGFATYTYPVSSGTNIATINFLNFKLGEIEVCKFYEGEPAETTEIILGSMEIQGEPVFLQGSGDCHTFSNLLPGTYQIIETLPEGYYNQSSTAFEVTVYSGDKKKVNFFNAQYGEIGDYVWEDADGDKIQDPGEKGIGGVEVNLYLDGALVATQITDANGGYLFSNLKARDYVVDVVESTVPTKFVLTTANDPMSITLDPGEVELGADFGYKKREGEVLAATGIFSPVNFLLALLALGLGIILRRHSKRLRLT